MNRRIVKKHQNDITRIQDKVISLYRIETSIRNIQDQIRDVYGYELSSETISSITDGESQAEQNGAAGICTIYKCLRLRHGLL